MEPIDVEATEVTHGGLVPVLAESATVKAAVTPLQAAQIQTDYYALCKALLTKDDYQTIQGKDFPKKSAFRKLNVAFNVSVEKLSEECLRDDRGRVIESKVVMRATHPNGRHQDGTGVCYVHERCCPAAFGDLCPKAGWNTHTCCIDGCPGYIHFSNAQHDIPATADTRATNRACADLYAMGQVSAEEIGQNQYIEPQYEEINGEQIPVDPPMQTHREGPGANLEKDRKRIYAMMADSLGRRPSKEEIAGILHRILGRDGPETTFKLDAAQTAQVIAELNRA